MRFKSGGRQVWRRDCRHCQILAEYRDAQDAREALRESGPFMQHEDDDFDREHPPLRFRDWLIEKAAEWREPG